MKKRILALLMILVMVSSLVGCGGSSKNKTLSQAFEEQMDMTTGVSDITIDFSYAGGTDAAGTSSSNELSTVMSEVSDTFNNLSLKITAVTESASPVKGSFSISYKYGTATEYSKLTTIIVNGEDVYVNANELKVAVTAIATEMNQPQIGVLLAMFQTEEYIKFNEKDMNDYVTKFTGVTVEESVSQMDEVALQQAVMVIAKHVMKAVEEVTKDVTPALISGKGSKVTLTISKENLVAVCAAVGKADLGAYYDAMVTELEAIKGAEDVTKQAKEQKDSILSELKESCEELQKEELPSDADAKVVYSLETSGKAGSRKATNDLTIEFKDGTDSLNVVLKAVSNEKIADNQKLAVPEKATTMEELMNSITSMLGGM